VQHEYGIYRTRKAALRGSTVFTVIPYSRAVPTFSYKHVTSLLRPLSELGTAYDVHLRLIGKLVVDFLLAIIELFSVAVMLVELQANNRLEIAVVQGSGSL